MLEPVIWIPAASRGRRARRCHVVMDGLQTAAPHLCCALGLPVTRAQQTLRRAAMRTRALRSPSQAVLCPTTQMVMAVLKVRC